MKYLVAYHTDIGTTKKNNQDALAIKVIEHEDDEIAFAIVCDGMGGLAKGELASKQLTMAFSKWFDNKFVDDIKTGLFSEERLVGQWNQIIRKCNHELGQFGKLNQLMLGTTVSAILMIKDEYYIAHVGDSRIYSFDKDIKLLTSDQTFVAREVAAGRMTAEQAEKDSRRSILLQCVGATPTVMPEFTKGKIKGDTVIMLCSDGFRHEVTIDEMQDKFKPEVAITEEKLKYGCVVLTEMAKSRGETDNISVVAIRVL